MKIFKLSLPIVLICVLILKSEENSSPGKAIHKTTSISDFWMDVNRMNGVFCNNGIWHYDAVAGDWGMEWPKGSGLSPMFAAGQWIGCKYAGQDIIRVAGVQHSATEFQPGMILPGGTADNPADPKYRWYSISAAGEGDWYNWPFDQGAPYVDENRNGKYDSGEPPMLIGDRTAFSVWNDLGVHPEFQSPALGVEVRQTVFAFNRSDAFGDMQFIRWQLVNKSGFDWNDTYFCIWTDPDVGQAGDDLVGCDSTLGLGFAYNASNNDQNYGSPPPAIGIDFFQGPIVESPGNQITLPDGTILYNKKMLTMTSFVYYNNDDSPQGNPQTATEAWNYFRGLWRDGTPITEGGAGTTPGNPLTRFMFSGDPETGTGWLDFNEADRRFIMTTGPFEMPDWDDENGNGMPDSGEPGVQEIVAVVIVAQGLSNLNSVTKLKTIDYLAQASYEHNFTLAQPAKKPAVKTGSLPGEIVLTWDDRSEYNNDGSPFSFEDPVVASAFGDTVIMDNTLKVINDKDYNFYGYSVYQYADLSGSNPVKIVHWDVGEIIDPVPYDNQRFLHIRYNRNPVVDDVEAPLRNGKVYYFGVSAETYLEFGSPKIMSNTSIIACVPYGGESGFDYSTSDADTQAAHIQGNGSGEVHVQIIDPSRLTGHTYQVRFKFTNGQTFWYVYDLTEGVIKMADVSNLNGDISSPIVDGIQVLIRGSQPGINFDSIGVAYGEGSATSLANLRGWDFTGTRWVSGNDWGGRCFFGGMDTGDLFFGSTTTPDQYVDVEIRFAGNTLQEKPEMWQEAYLYRRDQGYGYAGMGDVPFTAWDVEDDRQLNVCFVEMDGVHSLINSSYLVPANGIWDMGWHQTDSQYGFAEIGGREYIFIMASDYNPDGGLYDDNNWGLGADVLYSIWPVNRGEHPYLEGEFVIKIFAVDPLMENDVFQFTTTPPSAYTSTKGDVNLDMNVDISDVVTLVNGIIKKNPLGGAQEFAADFNEDLRINVSDVVGIIRYLLNGNSPAPVAGGIPKTGVQNIQFGFGTLHTTESGLVSVPLSVDTGSPVGGIQVELTYNPECVQPEHPEQGKNQSASMAFHADGRNTIRYLFYSGKCEALDVQRLPELRFKVLKAEGSKIMVNNVIAAAVDGTELDLRLTQQQLELAQVPSQFALHPNFPNPFNAGTQIAFELAADETVSVYVYNTVGQKIRTLASRKTFSAGKHAITWDGRAEDGKSMASGLYILSFRSGTYKKNMKMILLK